MTVTGALGLPSTRSPSGPSAISSARGGTSRALGAAGAVSVAVEGPPTPTPPPQAERASATAIRTGPLALASMCLQHLSGGSSLGLGGCFLWLGGSFRGLARGWGG